MAKRTDEAEARLAWFLYDSPSLLGYGAQRYEPSYGGDALYHVEGLDIGDRIDLERYNFIRDALVRKGLLEKVRKATADIPGARPELKRIFTRPSRICLLNLVLSDAAASDARLAEHESRVAVWKKKRKGQEPRMRSVPEFLWDEVARNRDRVLRQLMRNAERTWIQYVELFDEAYAGVVKHAA